MHRRQSGQHATTDVAGLSDTDSFAGADHARQALAGERLHDDPIHAEGVVGDQVIDGDRAAVTNGCRRAGLDLWSYNASVGLPPDGFEGHRAAEHVVERKPHRAR